MGSKSGKRLTSERRRKQRRERARCVKLNRGRSLIPRGMKKIHRGLFNMIMEGTANVRSRHRLLIHPINYGDGSKVAITIETVAGEGTSLDTWFSATQSWHFSADLCDPTFFDLLQAFLCKISEELCGNNQAERQG